MRLFAIDPGPEKSAWVLYETGAVFGSGIDNNEYVLSILADPIKMIGANAAFTEHLAIEKIESMGMAVGASVFETVFWTGRFVQCWETHNWPSTRVTRRQVKLHLCGSMRAKDQNIRQALIDKLGPQGTKKQPGPTFGVSSHVWAALAVAVTFDETYKLDTTSNSGDEKMLNSPVTSILNVRRKGS